MQIATQILIAILLDILAGDPRWLPHPVRMMGRFAAAAERLWRRVVPSEYLAGLLTVAALLGATGCTIFGLLRFAGWLHPLAGTAVSIYFLYAGIAARDLVEHSRAVHRALAGGDLETGRRRVGFLVARETAHLDEAAVARAAVESVAENLVDGITAPLFYGILGGPVAMMLYKAASTMDSMFGYKNATYRRFGWAAARLDDLANFLPARLTGLLIPLAASLTGLRGRDSWRILRRDRRRHASPNAGHPEAAVAGALGVQLGGPSVYFGAVIPKPTLGDHRRPLAAADIRAANRLVLATALLFTGLLLPIRMLL
ncbi:MAG: adenosylcobinamide-phosphate synthase CbiB [Desulfobacteraceae bacterium]|nr:adenosylcobinamide-phosphate synthase CbiB [Desulfobacteraceae bacterium]